MDDTISSIAMVCLLPVVFFLGYHLREGPQLSSRIFDVIKAPPKSSRDDEPGPFSVQRAILSFESYASLVQNEADVLRGSYDQLSDAHKRIGDDVGYPRKISRLEQITQQNAVVTDSIASLARREHSNELARSPVPLAARGHLGGVREAIRHFVRDWSDEGRAERETIFAPILNCLSDIPLTQRAGMKVLVPGCGLGRLAWEISELGQCFQACVTFRSRVYLCIISDDKIIAGYDTTAVELSSFMTLALRFLMSPSTTQQRKHHTIYPFATSFSHVRSNENIFRPISFPDSVPREKENFQVIQGDFLSHRCPPSPNREAQSKDGYDIVVTLFFIDTSVNIIATLEHIHSLLRPGGIWINLGPLLWTEPGEQARLEPSLEEVLGIAERVGFKIQDRRRQNRTKADSVEERQLANLSTTIECEYARDKKAMMRFAYRAEFWVAAKEER